MKKQSFGKFQSGKEVFARFIPNLKSNRGSSNSRILDEQTDCRASDLIDELLREFSSHFSIGLNTKSQS